MKLTTRRVMSGVLGCLLGIVIGYGIEGRDSDTIVEWVLKPITSLQTFVFYNGMFYGEWEYSPLVWATIGIAVGVLVQVLLTDAATRSNERLGRGLDREHGTASATPQPVVTQAEPRALQPESVDDAKLASNARFENTGLGESDVRQRPQTSPGFAQGRFGKAMAYVVLALGFILAFVSVRGAIFEPGPDFAYQFGRLMGPVAVIGGALRAVYRTRLAFIDWLCAIAMLLVCTGFVIAFVSFLAARLDPTAAIVGTVIFALMVVPLFIVAVRLVRRPYSPPAVSTKGIGF